VASQSDMTLELVRVIERTDRSTSSKPEGPTSRPQGLRESMASSYYGRATRRRLSSCALHAGANSSHHGNPHIPPSSHSLLLLWESAARDPATSRAISPTTTFFFFWRLEALETEPIHILNAIRKPSGQPARPLKPARKRAWQRLSRCSTPSPWHVGITDLALALPLARPLRTGAQLQIRRPGRSCRCFPPGRACRPLRAACKQKGTSRCPRSQQRVCWTCLAASEKPAPISLAPRGKIFLTPPGRPCQPAPSPLAQYWESPEAASPGKALEGLVATLRDAQRCSNHSALDPPR